MSDQPVRGAAPARPSVPAEVRSNGGPVHAVPAAQQEQEQAQEQENEPQHRQPRRPTHAAPTPINEASIDPREARRAARARAWRYGKYSWLRRQWPLLLVLAVVAVGLVVVVVDDFRTGAILFAAAVILAAAFRLFFPSRIVGLLVLRSRAIDVVTLTVLGVAALVLALIVPDIR
ncbi:DUF3017 domain-containing protein [Tenggerimyces flavus]|uniref:DUF3017 domain-containing protein n=1 Tax=Tenggerimyces flavus TaxID=1708749 RepID=A0ABV7Y3A3_9ACTN|nr:DUF3017 domain-containing protein [Tenggerimyces flavus]MBM7790893.1 hypothetical protein [Tenggerimyces flavus]